MAEQQLCKSTNRFISKPDLIMKIKGRDGDYDFVCLILFVVSNKTLTSNRNNAEKTDNDGVLSVNTDGFVVGAKLMVVVNELMKVTSNYVTYCFGMAGGNKNTFNVDDVGYASAAAAGLTGEHYHFVWSICWNQTRI